MAFRFKWPEFSSELLADVRRLLNVALNKGRKPNNIVSDIVVKELNMGSVPPELEILEISELSQEKFRGIFKFTYFGDAFVVLQTKVQANPVTPRKTGISILGNPRQDVLAAEPLVLPMRLRISSVCLKGIVVLVVDKHRGVTLAFKDDPVERVDVSSTFDGMPNVQRFLQAEIEKQLRSLFQDDLPAIVHALSLRYLQENWQRDTSREKGNPVGHEDHTANMRDRSEALEYGSAFANDQPLASDSNDQPHRRWEPFGNRGETTSEMVTETDYARLSSLYKGDGLKSLAQEACSECSESPTLRDDTADSFLRKRSEASSVAGSDISTTSTLRGFVIHRSGLLATARFIHRPGSAPVTGDSSATARLQNRSPEVQLYSKPDLRRCPSASAISRRNLTIGGDIWGTCQTPMEPSPTLNTRSPRPPLTPSLADILGESSTHKVNGSNYASNEEGLSATVPPASPRPEPRKFPTCHGTVDIADPFADNGVGGELEKEAWYPSLSSTIFLQPSQNAMAAQLVSLMRSNRTLSPHTLSGTIRHLAFRSTPCSPLATSSVWNFTPTFPSCGTPNIRTPPSTRSSYGFFTTPATETGTPTTPPSQTSYVSAAARAAAVCSSCFLKLAAKPDTRCAPHHDSYHHPRPQRHGLQECFTTISPIPPQDISPEKRSLIETHLVGLPGRQLPCLADSAR